MTGEATLQVTEAVLCGNVNKRIVRACQALGVNAAGISGQDGRTLVAQRATGEGGADLGYVGEIVAADPALVEALLKNGFLPVIAPLAIAPDGAHAYNVNADLAAAAVAAALRAQAFVLVTNVSRVLRDPDDPNSGVDRFTPGEALRFAESSACRSSMKPKLRAAAFAARDGAVSYVCAAKPGAIAAALRRDATVIASSRD